MGAAASRAPWLGGHDREAAGADKSLAGIALSPGIAVTGRLRGVALGVGLSGAGGNARGIVVGGIGGRLKGVALGGATVLATDVTGVAAGALNGVIVDRINLEDFLHFRMVNQRFTGLSIGLVNYTRRLHGVQLGLFNYAGNNRRALRLLPLVNAHL